MQKQKILFIFPWLPYPLQTGGHHGLMNALLALKDEIDIYIAFGVNDEDSYLEVSKGFLEIIPNAHLFPLHGENINSLPEYPLWYRKASAIKSRILRAIRRENNNVQIEVEKEYTACFGWIRSVSPLPKHWLEHVAKICEENQFDVIQVEMPWLVSLVLTLPEGPKKIFVHHELGFVRRELEQKKLSNNEYVKASRGFADMAEISLLNMYDAVVTVSPIDAQKLVDKGVTVPVYSSFSIVNSLSKLDKSPINAKHLTFIGPSSHSPNFVGVTWFLENCWTLLRSKDENYRLSIIGNWNEDIIADYSSKYPNVEFLGYVDSLADKIKGTIMIVPITIGSGIRMKILEASSLGVPFVSTSVGAEGLPVENGKNCFIADDKEMFVNCILKLQDTTIQDKFIENAHTMILEKFSIKALRENRLDIYKQVLNN